METKDLTSSVIYNLIILDESGSMDCVCAQTISGCNETIDTIKVAQKKYAENQQHFVSIYAFQSGGKVPSRYIIKNVPADAVQYITSGDYDPSGCTPLNDAVGTTLADLKVSCKSKPNAIGSVTIITDGMENSSKEYTTSQVAHMIEQLKEMGWSFNFIGANIDVIATSARYKIDNAMEFKQDDAGTKAMFAKERKSRMKYYERLDAVNNQCYNASEVSRSEMLKDAARGYFDEDEEKKENN